MLVSSNGSGPHLFTVKMKGSIPSTSIYLLSNDCMKFYSFQEGITFASRLTSELVPQLGYASGYSESRNSEGQLCYQCLTFNRMVIIAWPNGLDSDEKWKKKITTTVQIINNDYAVEVDSAYYWAYYTLASITVSKRIPRSDVDEYWDPPKISVYYQDDTSIDKTYARDISWYALCQEAYKLLTDGVCIQDLIKFHGFNLI